MKSKVTHFSICKSGNSDERLDYRETLCTSSDILFKMQITPEKQIEIYADDTQLSHIHDGVSASQTRLQDLLCNGNNIGYSIKKKLH